MKYIDINDYRRRSQQLCELVKHHPELMAAALPADRALLETYFMGAIQADNMAEYRRQQTKLDPTIELQANRAFERFMAEAGVPVTVTDPASAGE